MPYLLPCSCGETIPVEKSQSGSQVDCPTCHRSCEIPTMRELLTFEFVTGTPIADNRKSSPAARWALLRGITAALCFLVALFGLGRAGSYGVYRLSNPTNFAVEDLLRETEKSSQQLSVVETWDNWRYLQETGLRTKRPPQVFVIKRFLEKRDVEMARWGIAGAVGLLGLLATALWPASKKSRAKELS
ncbi:MAG: hypothetical protein SGI77_04665 [Pirellulaceae bacterium]|nr:hypothetical protein [Pirellulaceae bacterium]